MPQKGRFGPGATRALALALGLLAAAAQAALPPPSPEEAEAQAQKKAAADRDAQEQARKLAETMDRVGDRYRGRMQQMGKAAPAPVPVQAQAGVERQMERQKEAGPPTTHQGAPTTTMPPAKHDQKIEAVPGQGPTNGPPPGTGKSGPSR